VERNDVSKGKQGRDFDEGFDTAARYAATRVGNAAGITMRDTRYEHCQQKRA
jgi:hypothetical protein